MTALPLQHPEGQHVLSVAEYAALPESTDGRYELQEGIIVMSPRPAPLHQRCQRRLGDELHRQLPAGLEVLPEVDVELPLALGGWPGFVRVPDLVVVRLDTAERVDAEGGFIRASEVVLAVEIISRGSSRMDTKVKHREYADAGIPHYWIVDLKAPISLVACHVGGEFGYVDTPAATGTFSTQEPFPVTIRLTALI